MNKYVYRYEDHNQPGNGHAAIVMIKRDIIKETACYVWHAPRNFGGSITTFEEAKQRLKWDRNALIKTRKGAMRSRWSITPADALDAWNKRKLYQIERLRLTLERVELCLAAYENLKPGDVPAYIDGGHGPEQDNYNWTEY